MNGLHELVYFTDRDLGNRFPERLRAAGVRVETLMESGARLFVIVGRLTTEQAAATFLRQQKRIERMLRKESKPFIGKIRRDTVEVWLRSRDRHDRTS